MSIDGSIFFMLGHDYQAVGGKLGTRPCNGILETMSVIVISFLNPCDNNVNRYDGIILIIIFFHCRLLLCKIVIL